MKAILSFILALSYLSFAAEKYGVYDLQGNRLLTFEAERHELPEKTRQIKSGYPNKKIYVSSVQKGKASKLLSRYRYKAETGAYIEASRKETFLTKIVSLLNQEKPKNACLHHVRKSNRQIQIYGFRKD